MSLPARDPGEPVWTLLEVLAPAADYLADAGVENARFDAECLLGSVLGLSRLDLYLQYERPLSEEERASLTHLAEKLASAPAPADGDGEGAEQPPIRTLTIVGVVRDREPGDPVLRAGMSAVVEIDTGHQRTIF